MRPQLVALMSMLLACSYEARPQAAALMLCCKSHAEITIPASCPASQGTLRCSRTCRTNCWAAGQGSDRWLLVALLCKAL